MTGKERVLNMLDGKPVDRLPCHDSWWPETKQRYIDEGHIAGDATFFEVFDTDFCGNPWLNMTADLDFKDEVVAETEDTVTIKNGNGAYLKRHKKHTTTPEHVDFEVKDRGRKVILHSCGFVEPLVPGLVEAGIDCLQAMEVKAGMRMPQIAEKFKDQIAFMGNIDVRLLAANDLEGLKKEMDAKIIPLLESGGRYIVHSDHSIPPEVDFDTLKYFFEYGASLAKHYRPKG